MNIFLAGLACGFAIGATMAYAAMVIGKARQRRDA